MHIIKMMKRPNNNTFVLLKEGICQSSSFKCYDDKVTHILEGFSVFYSLNLNLCSCN